MKITNASYDAPAGQVIVQLHKGPRAFESQVTVSINGRRIYSVDSEVLEARPDNLFSNVVELFRKINGYRGTNSDVSGLLDELARFAHDAQGAIVDNANLGHH